MPHAIFVDRYAGRKPAWHHLGDVWGESENPTVEAAMRRARMLITVHSCPVYTIYNGIHIPLSDHMALVREPVEDDPDPVTGQPEPVPFGVVSKEYRVLQNEQIARMLENVARTWPIETVGMLDRGQRSFLTLRIGNSEVAGEQLFDYLFIVNGSDGLTGLNVGITKVRIVCQNTLITGLSSASTNISIPHYAGVADELDLTTQILFQARQKNDLVRERMEVLARLRLQAEEERRVLDHTFPLPKKPARLRAFEEAENAANMLDESYVLRLRETERRHEQQVDRIRRQRWDAEERYAIFNDEQPRLARTAWALYNAVVESADFRPSTQMSRQRLAESAILGARAQEKVRCWQALDRIADGQEVPVGDAVLT